MVSFYTSFLFISYMIESMHCQRRIVNGSVSEGSPGYIIYLIKDPVLEHEYTGWICGGCIVHPRYILTSAACLMDVKHVYAIAGYRKYVRPEEIHVDNCTSQIKQKVVGRIFQKGFNTAEFKNSHGWNSRDISLAKVERPYNFRDPKYVQYCSYYPTLIPVNFNSNFEDVGTQVVTFGWGHKKYYRMTGDTADYNERNLHYASTVVIDKNTCKDKLNGHSDMQNHVNLYLICTSGPGAVDENGKITIDPNLFNSSLPCGNKPNSTRKDLIANNNASTWHPSYSMIFNQSSFRRYGTCQNDHGGPLVTWIGGRQYVIGVACSFQVNKQMECVGPFLYTSTYRNSQFIYCILRYARAGLCNPQTSGKENLHIVEEAIDWDQTRKTKA